MFVLKENESSYREVYIYIISFGGGIFALIEKCGYAAGGRVMVVVSCSINQI